MNYPGIVIINLDDNDLKKCNIEYYFKFKNNLKNQKGYKTRKFLDLHKFILKTIQKLLALK